MNGDNTARLNLPLLHAGQAQKEVDHNEALALLDMAVQPVVVAIGLDTPPKEPGEGACWIIGTNPVEAWAGRAGSLAGWTAGGWRFIAPRTGMTVVRGSDGMTARYTGADWVIGEVRATGVLIGEMRVLGARQPAIADPAGGPLIDAEARGALSAALSALRAHGLIAP
ncbi:DUF2793 domain-containing protein [Sphingomonas jeddahensis]|uniref:DUF2793 domain-containing protein n=1 Tax=Sphingomonas jeddahensis TaxID=1915074 RepID=A0A1V2EQT5_9SPHN|nr:DUF2793 domain-containing protein [Sphingomonas jeddahensis]ONF94950.1 hypothetical protein SPHI_28890 [Sphingomonas jeddahensis]